MLEMECSKPTKAQVELWQAGWKSIKQLEVEEAKQRSLEERWRELNALFNFAFGSGFLRAAGESDVAAVRSRWAHLKANYP